MGWRLIATHVVCSISCNAGAKDRTPGPENSLVSVHGGINFPGMKNRAHSLFNCTFFQTGPGGRHGYFIGESGAISGQFPCWLSVRRL